MADEAPKEAPADIGLVSIDLAPGMVKREKSDPLNQPEPTCE
jgi:hypothetical protein